MKIINEIQSLAQIVTGDRDPHKRRDGLHEHEKGAW
ncbi:MAG: hypothetical protein AVDCRST_MAG43-33 [uncultured Thermomicrobiales bacterium]|uniref:Uncharacterized protein n=1 Tax=uncultured Thermomicrobiales bacterium TaxID=1645740 RepID=A0A6J4U4I8_9BACT|nr:MAG: hypothetical protein AVDCRST_MAG43-33 [uncultured Thermomicrobiales bacterium]